MSDGEDAELILDGIEETLETGRTPLEQAKNFIWRVELECSAGLVLHGALKAAIIAEVNSKGYLSKDLEEKVWKRMRDIKRGCK